jgi:hypothetical protein
VNCLVNIGSVQASPDGQFSIGANIYSSKYCLAEQGMIKMLKNYSMRLTPLPED